MERIKNRVCFALFNLGLFILIGVLISCSHKEPKFLSEKYIYDKDGEILSFKAANGQLTNYTYNDQKLPIEIKYSGGSTTFGYDANGNRVWMKDSKGISKYFYDASDRLIGFISNYKPKKIITYNYDSWGYLMGMAIYDIDKMSLDPKYKLFFTDQNEDTDEDLTKWKVQEERFSRFINLVETDNENSLQKIEEYYVRYNHNIWGNLTRIDTKEGSIVFLYFPDQNQVVRQLPNGIKSTYTYTPDGHIQSIRHSDVNGKLLAKYEYSYNVAGKVTQVNEESQTGTKVTEYDWDSRGYLQKIRLPDGNSYSYTYDLMGNRSSQINASGEIKYSYDGYGRHTKAGNANYEWDKNGQLIEETNKSSTVKYKYDGRNLPVFASTDEVSLGYKWNGDGNLVSEQRKKEITYYLPDPLSASGNTLAEYDAKGNVKVSFIYGGGFIGQFANNKMNYFLEDGFCSVRNITDPQGNIVSQIDYSQFGEPTVVKGNLSCDYRNQGEKYLPDLKKYLIGNRLFDPFTGRYISPDPEPGYMERMDSYNRYTHGSPDPTNFMEPRCNQTMHQQGFFQALNNGTFFGTRYGEEALNYYANKWAQTDNPLYAIPGAFSALWTPDTWKATALTLAPPILGRLALQPLIAKGALAGSRAEPFHLKLIPFKPLENLIHYGINKFGPHIGLGLGKKSLIHIYSNYIRFGSAKNGINLFADVQTVFLGVAALSEPIKSLTNQIGGISLDATAHFSGKIGNIKSVVYNKEKQCVILIGDGNTLVAGMKPEDLAIAIKSEFQSIPSNLQFSLDPADRNNPHGEWMKSVYIPERLTKGTSVGDAMFEADWLLKQYSFGVTVDSNGKMSERNCNVAGFKNMADLSLEMKDDNKHKPTWNRLWIVAKELDDDKRYNMLLKVTPDGNAMYFETAKMAVKVKQQVIDPSSPTGLSDIEGKDPIATKFADFFTKSYDQIAIESNDFERVRDITKAIALAKWIKQQNIPVDMNWVNETANKRGLYVDKVPSLSVQWNKHETKVVPEKNGERILTQINKINLFGGVDATVKPKWVTDKGSLNKLQELVNEKIKEQGICPIYNIDYEGTVYRAVILPVTKSGRDILSNMHVAEDNGRLYHFNNKKEIIKIVDEAGNTTDLSYNPDHSIRTFQTIFNNHWKSSGEKTSDGSKYIVTNPRGNNFQYDYAADGTLKEVVVDGKTWAKYNYNDKLLQRIISRNEGQEQIQYNKKGQVTSYEYKPKQSDPIKPTATEAVSITYGTNDQVEKIEGSGMPTISLFYEKGVKQPVTISTPTIQVNYKYDAAGRPVEATNLPGSSSITSEFNGDLLETVHLRNGDKSAFYTFNEHGIEKINDFSGNSTEIAYSKGGDVVSVKDGIGKGEIRFNQNRSEIRFPDGKRQESLFEEKLKKAEKSLGFPVFEYYINTYPYNKLPVRSPLQKIFWWRIFSLSSF